MMMIFYFFILAFGCISFLVVLRQHKVFSLYHKINKKEKDVPTTTIKYNAQYEMLLESSSHLVHYLSQLEKSLLMKLLIVAVCSGLLFTLHVIQWLTLTRQEATIIFTIIVAATIILPGVFRKVIVNTKIKVMMNKLPFFIDLIAVCIQSGMTVEYAFSYLSPRFHKINSDLAMVMHRVVRRAEVNGLNSALNDLCYTLPTSEIKMLSSALQQSVYFGTSVYEQLMELSKYIRELQLLNTEERVGKLAAKISLPLILFVAFPIIILITAPSIMKVLSNV